VCFFEQKGRKGVEPRLWRVVSQLIGPLESQGFGEIVANRYWSSQRYG